MKTETTGSNGIGPLVRAYVHERNAARKGEGASAPTETGAQPASADTAEFSAGALARFEAWKAKHSAWAPIADPGTDPITDPVEPGTEPPAVEATPGTEPPTAEAPPSTDPIPAVLEPLLPADTTPVNPIQELINELTITLEDTVALSILA